LASLCASEVHGSAIVCLLGAEVVSPVGLSQAVGAAGRCAKLGSRDRFEKHSSFHHVSESGFPLAPVAACTANVEPDSACRPNYRFTAPQRGRIISRKAGLTAAATRPSESMKMPAILTKPASWMTKPMGCDIMRFANYLGQKASCLLEAEPFKNWPIKRSVDDDSDPPEVRYSFVNCGLRFNCDRHDERVNSLFLEAEEHAGTILSEVPFHLRRDEVLARFGSPSKCGEGFSHPVLGDYGPWDRFQGPQYTVHVQYKACFDSIEKITLMRNDVVPGGS
jgi:hypothetical protein